MSKINLYHANQLDRVYFNCGGSALINRTQTASQINHVHKVWFFGKSNRYTYFTVEGKFIQEYDRSSHGWEENHPFNILYIIPYVKKKHNFIAVIFRLWKMWRLKK